MTQTTPLSLDEYVAKRFKEILEEGGYEWTQFSSEEKVIAALQAEKEYAAMKRGWGNA